MNKALFPLLALVLVGCGGTSTPTSSVEQNSSSLTASENDYTLHDAIGWFQGSVNVNATYSFFDSAKTPGAATAYLPNACFSTYRNFTNLDKKNVGLIDVDAALATSKGIATGAGVYKWTKGIPAPTEEKPNGTTPGLNLGEKVGTTSYKEMYHTPFEIAEEASTYESAFVPEIAGQKSGYFFLNKDGSKPELATKLSKSLGVYETITGAGLSINYVKMYFGATNKVINFSIYAASGGHGYDAYVTSVSCASFGEVSISEISSYLGA